MVEFNFLHFFQLVEDVFKTELVKTGYDLDNISHICISLKIYWLIVYFIPLTAISLAISWWPSLTVRKLSKYKFHSHCWKTANQKSVSNINNILIGWYVGVWNSNVLRPLDEIFRVRKKVVFEELQLFIWFIDNYSVL